MDTIQAPGLLEVTVEYARRHIRVFARPDFWEDWMAILRFSQTVYGELQDLDQSIDSLIETVYSQIINQKEPGMKELFEVQRKWLSFSDRYRGRAEPNLFTGLDRTLTNVDQALTHMRQCADTPGLVGVVNTIQVTYNSMSTQLRSFQRLVDEIDKLIRQDNDVPASSADSKIDQVKLHAVLNEWLLGDDVRQIYFTLNVDYDRLGGDTKPGKLRELIQFCAKTTRLEELVKAILTSRPDLGEKLLVAVPKQLVFGRTPMDYFTILADRRNELAAYILWLQNTFKLLADLAVSLNLDLVYVIVQK